MRFLVIISILLISCQQENLSNQEKLSGIWVNAENLNSSKDIPDTVHVTEYEFISDTSGLLFIYDFFTKSSTSNKEQLVSSYLPDQDSFLINKSFSKLTIIPGHLSNPVECSINQMTDTLVLHYYKFNTTDTFYKLNKIEEFD